MSGGALIETEHGLGLIHSDFPQFKPVVVDFTKSALLRRIKQHNIHQEGLIKALGDLKKKDDLKVIDATAGLGTDSFLLAAMGARVMAFERDPLTFEVLFDGLQRGQKSTDIGDIIDRITLIKDDAIDAILSLEEPVDIIYLDPMFATKQNSAKVKKEMQILQHSVNQPVDEEILFDTALQMLCKKMIVKRHVQAPHLNNQIPHHQVIGASTRFDIYIL